MRTIATTVVMLLLGSLQAWAQSPGSGFNSTVAAVAGAGKTWDDEGQIGTGPVVGVRADRRLAGNTFAEVSLEYLRHERTGRFAAEGRTLFLTGSVIQRFGRGGTQPYVLGGITMAHHSGTFGFPEDHLVSSTKSRSVGWLFGGGVAVAVGSRFEVGPEVRFLTIAADTDSAPAYAYWVGGRFGIRF